MSDKPRKVMYLDFDSLLERLSAESTHYYYFSSPEDKEKLLDAIAARMRKIAEQCLFEREE